MLPCSACSLSPLPCSSAGICSPLSSGLERLEMLCCNTAVSLALLVFLSAPQVKRCMVAGGAPGWEREGKQGCGWVSIRAWSLFLILSLLVALPRRLLVPSPHCHQLFIACSLSYSRNAVTHLLVLASPLLINMLRVLHLLFLCHYHYFLPSHHLLNKYFFL